MPKCPQHCYPLLSFHTIFATCPAVSLIFLIVIACATSCCLSSQYPNCAHKNASALPRQQEDDYEGIKPETTDFAFNVSASMVSSLSNSTRNQRAPKLIHQFAAHNINNNNNNNNANIVISWTNMSLTSQEYDQPRIRPTGDRLQEIGSYRQISDNRPEECASHYRPGKDPKGKVDIYTMRNEK